MKKILLTILTLIFAVGLNAETVKKNYHFSNPTFETIKGYQQISFDGLLLTGQAGEPTLPYQSVVLLIPPGHTALNIKLDFGEEIEMEGVYNIYPMQYVQPVSKGKSGIFAFKEDVYKKDAFYPEKMEGVISTHFMNGFAVAISSFTPVRYNPYKGKLSYFEDVTVTIETAPDSKAIKALENINTSPAVLQRLALLVENSEAAVNYPKREVRNDDYDLLIITAAQFENAFQPLISFYQPRGIRTKVVSTQTIYSTTSGQDNQEKIRNYVIDQYQNNGIQHLTLAGDVEHVPYRGFYCSVQSSSVYTDNDIPSDLYFSALDGTWNNNNNNLWGEIGEDDLLPEIGVGRMSFSSQSELSAMLNKIYKYVGEPVLGELRDPLLAGEHLYNNPLTWGCDYLELLIGYHDDNGYITNGIPTDHNIMTMCDENGTWSANQLKQKINQGTSFIHHCGHANSNYAMRFYNSDITNSNFSQVNGEIHNFTLAYSHGCICGAFDDNDCIAERMINIDNLAVAVVMNSRYGWFNEGQTEGPSAHLHREFVDALYTTKEPHIGMTHTLSRIKTAPWVNAPGQWEEGALRWCFYDCNVLGESALRIWTDEPVDITASYQNALPIGVPSIQISISGNGSVEGLACTLIKEGVTHGTAITNSSGLAEIIFDPPITELGEAIIYISGYNCLLNEFPLIVIPNDGAYVIYESSLVNDSQGNGNGLPDYTESILLTTTLKNVGSSQADNVTASLTSANPYVTITNNSAYFGTIPGQGSLTIEDAFEFDIAGNVPDQQAILFNIEAVGQNNWSSGFSIIANAPNLVKDDIIINDASNGNNNGILDPGETADMVITIINSGHAEAYSVKASLTSADQYITVNTTTPQSLGNMTPEQSIPATFSVFASPDTPAGYTGQITLNITAQHGVSTTQTINLNFTDYCYPTANCSFGDGITGFGLASINNMNNGCSNNGYGNFTDMSTELEPGQTYQVSFKTGYSNQKVCLWIDFNSNKEFEQSERLVTDFSLSNSNQVYTTTITIPESITGGIKRLRIRARWMDSAQDPCANFTYGETEDYTVIFPAGQMSINAWCTPDEICLYDSTQLMVTATGGTGNYSYLWTPAAGLSDPTIQNPTASPSETTTYTVEVNDGSSSINADVLVIVNPLPPTPTIALTGNTLTSSSPTGNQWYCSQGAIEGATGQSYTCTWEDVYFVKVTNENGCVSMQSNSIHVVIYSIDDFEHETDFNIYPNPFNDEVFINSKNSSDKVLYVSVFNNLGQEVLKTKINSKSTSSDEIIKISTAELDNGVYFFKIYSENRVIIKKLIRNR
ncbi:MAG TPA: C25 family cysteine peptidase [Bacteroidales bacterium]|nr:C25 family cysteine peptidase [Bacteroidales bacterium]HQH14879.1 C25 family cysteine peptidase [Bacteroidales bacterium]